MFLEDLLGLTTGNVDILDSLGWELKYYTSKTALIVLSTRSISTVGIIRYMIRKLGWKDVEGTWVFGIRLQVNLTTSY